MRNAVNAYKVVKLRFSALLHLFCQMNCGVKHAKQNEGDIL